MIALPSHRARPLGSGAPRPASASLRALVALAALVAGLLFAPARLAAQPSPASPPSATPTPAADGAGPTGEAAPTPAAASGGAPSGRGSLSLADRQVEVALEQFFARDGERLETSARSDQPLELVVRFSWRDEEATIAEAKVALPEVTGAALAPEAAAALATVPAAAREGERVVLEWRLPLIGVRPGLVRVGALSGEYLIEGFDRRLRADGLSATIDVRQPPFRWVGPLLQWLGVAVALALAGVGGWFGVKKLRVLKLQRSGAFFSSDDPTPFERIHAELASCEMKAQIEDFEGFFRKFRPLVYRFASVTEGPAITTFSPDELAKHFEAVGYDPKIAARLIDFLRVCDRYVATGDDPTIEQCMTMTRMLRQLASQCVTRSPRAGAMLHDLD